MESGSTLLRRFAVDGDETAFERLVERHAPMMLGIALRCTGDQFLAEEVVQNVFTILVRKGKALRHQSVAGWLHRTTLLEARNAARKATRYQQVLHRFRNCSMNTPSQDFGGELLSHLDDAMARLPSGERELVVLRYFERQTVRDIAGSTGTSEEACKKRLQRAVNHLACLLQKRGLTASATRLAVTLSTQGFCGASASAAAITAAALKTAPTLSSSFFLTHTLHLMNTGTIFKTAAITAVVAAIPITVLWNRSSALSHEISQLQREARMRPVAPATAVQRAESPRDNVAALAPSNDDPKATDATASSPLAGLASLFSGDKLKEMAQHEANEKVDQAFNRICLILPDLTEDQRARIRDALEKRSAEQTAAGVKFIESGGMAKIMNIAKLTPEEREELRKSAPPRQTPADEAELLKPILTEEQFAQHASVLESRRKADAENVANTTLQSLGRNMDLDEDQKDRIFSQLAQHELARVGADTLEDAREAGELRDEIIRANLTPQQVEIYNQTRAPEKQNWRSFMKMFPGSSTGQTQPQ